MKEKLDRLISLLTDLLALYQGILELSRCKREVLTAGNTQELERITKQEELLILQVGKLEKARETVIKEIITGLNLNCSQLTLSQIKKIVEPGVAAQLEKITDGLNAVITELTSLSEINTRLIQQAMHFINFNINIMAQHASDSTYAPQGQQGQSAKPAQAKTFFDQKI